MARSEAAIMRDILGAYCALSPENLWMDGEATRAQAKARERSAKAQLATLFRELGRTVDETTAFTYYREAHG